MKYTLKQAQKNFEQLVEDACAGKEVLIVHKGRLFKLEGIKHRAKTKAAP